MHTILTYSVTVNSYQASEAPSKTIQWLNKEKAVITKMEDGKIDAKFDRGTRPDKIYIGITFTFTNKLVQIKLDDRYNHDLTKIATWHFKWIVENYFKSIGIADEIFFRSLYSEKDISEIKDENQKSGVDSKIYQLNDLIDKLETEVGRKEVGYLCYNIYDIIGRYSYRYMLKAKYYVKRYIEFNTLVNIYLTIYNSKKSVIVFDFQKSYDRHVNLYKENIELVKKEDAENSFDDVDDFETLPIYKRDELAYSIRGIKYLNHYSDLWWVADMEKRISDLDEEFNSLRLKYIRRFSTETSFFDAEIHPDDFWWRKDD
jgi:hypothetical protein